MQLIPLHPRLQLQVPGLTQVPPLRHPSKQIATYRHVRIHIAMQKYCNSTVFQLFCNMYVSRYAYS